MPVGGNHFSSVRKAKEALKARAHEILDGYLSVIKQAAAAGDFETAVKGYQHLLDHMPEEEGERILDGNIDKKMEAAKGNTGPLIQIGLQIGGVTPQKQLPATVIEVLPNEEAQKDN